MIRLYQPSILETEQTISLDKKPSHHLIRVLRARAGSEVVLFNGDGHDYLANVLDESSKKCTLYIKHKIKINNESPLSITLLQGISRGDRMDTSIQKSIELGVHAIIPILCQRTSGSLKGDRAEKKFNHWQQIIISACEQSGRSTIPEIKQIVDLKTATQSINSKNKIILAPNAGKTINKMSAPKNEIYILIGPEGGFAEEEIECAVKSGFTAVSLGPRILRTETAGPACIAIAQSLWGDLG